MPGLTYSADERPVPESTLVDLLYEGVAEHGDAPALRRIREDGTVEDISHVEMLEAAKRVAAALVASGHERGDRVSIFAENRVEWALTDYGCLCAGVVDVPVYTSLTAPQVRYILDDSGSRTLFVSTSELLDVALEAVAACDRDIPIVVFDPPDPLPRGVTTWDDFLIAGEAALAGDEDFERSARSAKPDDVATILYTSGTTGEPKGVMLTHNNLASNARAVDMVLDVLATDSTVSFLQLSHSLQRMADYLLRWKGCTVGYPRSLDTLLADMRTLRPTIVVSVPRVYEKIYNGVMNARGAKKALLGWAVGVADRVADLRLAGREPGGALALQYRIADRLVFSKVKAAVGGNLRFFVSGGGPLAPALNRFFYSIGMLVLEGYGLTETSPVTNVTTVEDFRIGSVGRPIPSTEVRIADDGEILIRGPQVMKGYYQNPEATAKVIDADGWLATGDIGELEEGGFLKITDRKKDIIVTAGGKNVAPQPIENLIKTNPLVEQAVLIGDRRRYCSMLVVPDFAVLETWARQAGISWADREELIRRPEIVAHVQAEILGMLSHLASFEQPKRVALLPEEFTVENGYLTPSLKVKRRVVQERLRGVIDGLYAEEAADVTGP